MKRSEISKCIHERAEEVQEATRILTSGDNIAAREARWKELQRYRYLWPSINGKGQEVRYCWGMRRCEGAFWTWREVVGKASFKRDMWRACKTRTKARKAAIRRHNAYVDKLTKEVDNHVVQQGDHHA